MKNLLTSLLLILSLNIFAQTNLEEVVYLKNGTSIHGIILEQIPNEKIKIQSNDGSIFVFKYAEIMKITKEPIIKDLKSNVITPSYTPSNNVSNNNSYTNNYTTGGMLQNGTPIFVKLLNNISSGSTDEPNFVVNGDVKDASGSVLIADGTQVKTEYKATKKKALGRPGTIEIKFISTTSVDNQFITVTGSKNYTAVDKKGKVIGIAVGVGLTLVFPMLAYLAKKGDDIEVSAGTMLTNNIIVMGNYTIK